jgi:hypothetical protein
MPTLWIFVGIIVIVVLIVLLINLLSLDFALCVPYKISQRASVPN